MAVRPVLRMGDPRLLERSQEVERFGTPELEQLLVDMHDTMTALSGAGLAAPQIGVQQRVVIFGVGHNPRYPDAEQVPYTVLINPIITPVGDEQEEDWEGCLSVPDLRGQVPRYTRVRVEAYDRAGQVLRFTADGFHARVVQHECDHLDGTVYLDRMRSMATLSFLPEFQRYTLGRDPEGD